MQCSGWSIAAFVKLHLSVGALRSLQLVAVHMKLKQKTCEQCVNSRQDHSFKCTDTLYCVTHSL